MNVYKGLGKKRLVFEQFFDFHLSADSGNYAVSGCLTDVDVVLFCFGEEFRSQADVGTGIGCHSLYFLLLPERTFDFEVAHHIISVWFFAEDNGFGSIILPVFARRILREDVCTSFAPEAEDILRC